MKKFKYFVMLFTAVILTAVGLTAVGLYSVNIYASEEISEDKLVYSCNKNPAMKIAITFDDGPHPVHTAEILDILKEFDVKATFFVVGRNAKWFPDLIQREIREGHEIGNHTYKHVSMRNLNKQDLEREILLSENVLYELCEYRPKLIRPPGGRYNDKVCTSAEQLDYRIVLWTIDTEDWKKIDSEKIYKTVSEKIKSGDIVLFHDLIAGDSPTPDALRKIIPELLSRGFKFVTVSELISSAGS